MFSSIIAVIIVKSFVTVTISARVVLVTPFKSLRNTACFLNGIRLVYIHIVLRRLLMGKYISISGLIVIMLVQSFTIIHVQPATMGITWGSRIIILIRQRKRMRGGTSVRSLVKIAVYIEASLLPIAAVAVQSYYIYF